MSKRNMTELDEALGEYFRRRGLGGRIEQASVVNEWERLVGRQLAKVSHPECVDSSGTLWVRVKSAPWVQELQLMSPVILQELARHGKRVKRVRWIAGSEADVQAKRR